MNQQLPDKKTKYRAIVADHQQGTYKDLGKIFDSVSEAQSTLKKYFDSNPPQTVTDYDIGGYVEKVSLKLVYNPKTRDFFDIKGEL